MKNSENKPERLTADETRNNSVLTGHFPNKNTMPRFQLGRKYGRKGRNMNTTAITLKAMQNTPAEEFGNIARAQCGIPKSIVEKKAYVMGHIDEEFEENMSDAFFEHTYRAMRDYGMDIYDSEKWAWLNTLFGYDIGAERAKDLIAWYDANGMDVLELTAEEKEDIRNIAEMELGLHLNFAAFAKETPDKISYTWPDHI